MNGSNLKTPSREAGAILRLSEGTRLALRMAIFMTDSHGGPYCFTESGIFVFLAFLTQALAI